MRRRWGGTDMITRTLLMVALVAINGCDGARRQAQRRKDTAALLAPTPSAETLAALAHETGAAEFEHYTEGRPLVKRLIPDDGRDADLVEHQGVIGKAGVDFPAFPSIPNTGFNCKNVPTGYYADLETDCQVFHICDTSRKISFLCPNGTIFSQSHLICDWWFKVDCASAPALYESSAEYYSNEQKKTKLNQNNYKADLQQIGTDNNFRAEPRRPTTADVQTTTERFLRHKQKLQNLAAPKTTARSFQSLITVPVYPTQRFQGSTATTAFDRRRKNLVQLISNFGNAQPRTTPPTFAEPQTLKTTAIAPGDYNSIKEMQEAAETASFTNNNNRQYLQDLNNKNLRPYPVYTPTQTNQPAKQAKSKPNPTLTTLYDIGVFNFKNNQPEITTKRSTLVPYTKSYANLAKEPYTRPGISLLRNFLEKEKNKTVTTTETPKAPQATQRNDVFEYKNNFQNKVSIENKNTFESATKIPLTTRSDFSASASTAKYEVYTSPSTVEVTTEPNYKERRERLMRKLNFGDYATEPTPPESGSEKFYGDQPNRPGLIVPPSLTPKTLHTLAIYYATALDNLSTTTAPTESAESTVNYDEYSGPYENLPGLFSPETINKYTHLFGHGTENPEALGEIKMDPNVTYNEIIDDLTVQQSQNPFATSPQIRELAQVFTHALSAYLQDPVQFRKVLSDIRPTPPSFGEIFTTEDSANTEPTTTVNEDDEEILGFSDDSKSRSPLVALREPKQLNFGSDYPTTVQDYTTTPAPTVEIVTATPQLTTTRRPYICCGRISASYTSPTSPRDLPTTSNPFTNTVATNVNTLANYKTETTTENSYTVPRYGGFQNNSINDYSPYGQDAGKPLNDYVASTNLPTAWGIDSTAPVADTEPNLFESKKIRSTTASPITTTPVYFTETDASIELENDEQLQRAQSHSFVSPKSNSIRQGKQLNAEETATTVRKPSEELEAPTLPDFDESPAQTTPQATTYRPETTESLTTVSTIQSDIFTSPDSERNDFQWPSTLQNWQSTIIDPITLNDNLSPESQRQAQQTNNWLSSTSPTPTLSYATTVEPAVSTTYNVEISTPTAKHHDRLGRLLRDQTSTEPAQDITTIADAFVEKAKEIMGGMNATTTQKLMNVMKKTKSKTVKRLILLLVQTCDDDHNSTAEASKRALLEALMAVSQKDMDEIAKVESSSETPATESEIEDEKSNYVRRTDQVLERQQVASNNDRRGKSINFDASAINSLSNQATTETPKTTTEAVTEAVSSTTPVPVRTTVTSRRGTKKFLSRVSPVEVQAIKEAIPDSPIAAARIAAPEELKTTDTRALELLRSLYTIASRWG